VEATIQYLTPSIALLLLVEIHDFAMERREKCTYAIFNTCVVWLVVVCHLSAEDE
jgi:hypothetical protein